jgi:hypothetical protein
MHPKILLVTFNWSTLTELPYLFKQAGCVVHIACPKSNALIKTSFYERWFDTGDSMDSLLCFLASLVKDNDYRYILIGDDPILWEIYTQNITALSALLPIHNQSALPILNKVGFAEHCHVHGIPSPAFKKINCALSAQEALKTLGLPIVIKKNYSNGGLGVSIFKEAQAYNEYMAAYAFKDPLLAQSFLVGEQIGVNALFKNGQLLQYACAVDIDAELGPATKRRYFQDDGRIGIILKQIGGSALLHGFANVRLLRETITQRYYLIEADPRPTKWVAYARWFGCDFIEPIQYFLADRTDDHDYVIPTIDSTDIDCWEVEFFPTHAIKLFNQGRTNEAILHLLDYKRTSRYTFYDPILLEAKMDSLKKSLVFESPSKSVTHSLQENKKMTIIKIDDKDYDTETLSDEAKAQLQSLQFVDQELARLQAQAAVLQTARIAYGKALNDALGTELVFNG